MVHQPSGGYQGQATDIMIHAAETQKLKTRLNEIYVKHTGNPSRKSRQVSSVTTSCRPKKQKNGA